MTVSEHVEFHLWLLTKAGIHLPAQREVWHHSKNFESEFSCDEIALDYRTNFPVYTALSYGCSGLRSKLLQLCRLLEIPKHARCWQYCPVIHEAGKHVTQIWPRPTHITHSKAVLLYSLLPVPLFCRCVTSHMILILSFLMAMRVGLNDGWYISDTGDTGVLGQLWSSTLKAVKHILDRNLATGGEQQIWSSAIRPRLCFTPF